MLCIPLLELNMCKIFLCLQMSTMYHYTGNLSVVLNKFHLHYDFSWRIMTLQAYDAIRKLFPMKPASFSYWQNMFKRSSAVHFFSKKTAGLKVLDDPRYSAYALLGPHYCPVAYRSVANFWFHFFQFPLCIIDFVLLFNK